MIRFVLTISMMLASFPMQAASLHLWTGDQIKTLHPEHDPFQEAMDAFEHSYRDSPGADPLPVLRMTTQLPLVMGFGWWIVFFLPQQRRRGARLFHAALAAFARSRMR